MRIVQGIAAAALLAASAPAAAQPSFHEPPDSHMVSKIELGADRTRRLMNVFARCVAKKRRAHSEALLALPYGSPEQGEAAKKIVEGQEGCVPVTSPGQLQMSFQADTLIGGIAEELARARYRKGKDSRPPGITPEQAVAAGLTARNGAEAFGQCVVLEDITASYAFVASKIAAPEEHAAALALRPHLENCVMEGQTLALNKAALRILLSVSLHQVLSLPPVAAP